MKLRSGTTLIINTNLEKCEIFIEKCKILSEEITNSTSWSNTLYNIFRLYYCLNLELKNINSHLKCCPTLKQFLIGMEKSIPEHIVDIISLDRYQDMSVTWKQQTGLNLIETSKIMYNLRFCLKYNVHY
jgi:hypothetical protein